jgi:hypothetical protein
MSLLKGKITTTFASKKANRHAGTIARWCRQGIIEHADKSRIIGKPGYLRNQYQIPKDEFRKLIKLAEPHDHPFFMDGKEYWPARLAHKKNPHFNERTGRRYQNKPCPQLGWEILHCEWDEAPFLKGQTKRLPGYLAEDVKRFGPPKKGRGSIPNDKLWRDKDGYWAALSLACFLTRLAPDEIKKLRKRQRIKAKQVGNYTARGPRHKRIWVYHVDNLRTYAPIRPAFDARLTALIRDQRVEVAKSENGQQAAKQIRSITTEHKKEIRKKRSREKHERWKEMRGRGMSLGQIANAEDVSREAVVWALKHL